MIELRINNENVDLFDGESIKVNSSVKRIQSLDSVYADFTRPFTIPATKRNNKVLKHFYRDDVANGIPYVKRLPAKIFSNGNLFKEGSIEVIKAKIVDGTPSFYTVNFYGKVSRINELGKEISLKNLDFSEYDHSYDGATIKTGVQTGLSSGDVFYPLASPVRRWEYDSNVANTNSFNIAYHGDIGHSHGLNFYELKPAIKVEAILSKIEEEFGISFTGDFITSPRFRSLFMWLHTYEGYMFEGQDFPYEWQRLDLSGFSQGAFAGPRLSFTGSTVNNSFKVRTLLASVQGNLDISGVSYSAPFYMRMTKNGGGSTAIKYFDGVSTTWNVDFGVKNGDKLYFEFYSPTSQNITISNIVINEFNTLDPVFSITAPSFDTLRSVVVANLMPDMKVNKFLAGLISMYNLTITTKDGLTFELREFGSYYDSSETVDLNRKLDSSSIEVSQPVRYKAISLKYADSEQFNSRAFELVNGRGYGELLESFDYDVQDEFKIEVPFEVPFMQTLGDTSFPVFFCQSDSAFDPASGDSESYYKNPIFFYGGGSISLPSGDEVAYLDEGLNYSSINTVIYFGLGEDDSPTESLLFSKDAIKHPSENGYISLDNNQYTIFWQGTLERSFSPRTRMLRLDGVLNEAFISSLNLDDIIEFAGGRYTINEISTELTSGRVAIELLTVV